MRISAIPLASMAAAVTLFCVSAHAIDRQYAKKLERSGCTQVSEAQGCDINKSKAENAKAGFGPAPAKPTGFKDLAGTSSISAIDAMAERGFKSVDAFETGNTQYGIYYRARNRQCVQLTMADGKVVAANDIKRHPKCR